MQINKAALEIFDFTSSLAVYSEHELKVGDQAIQDYIANHVVKAFKDPAARTGTLHDASPFGKQLVDYKNGNLKFIDLSKNLGESLFTYMKQATDSVVIDTIICEAITDASYI
ncbi:MAG: nucleoid-associated protein, partial [Veillonella sp.]|nr:nucleoid-associated protein [Veillonella sp.]